MENPDNSRQRTAICPGLSVDIIQKQDQHSGRRVRGIVQDILTSSLTHPHGIKVKLKDGRVGRVAEIFPAEKKETGSYPVASSAAGDGENTAIPTHRNKR
jgi:uncharacterized repeat protein (TIGR03833 family)